MYDCVLETQPIYLPNTLQFVRKSCLHGVVDEGDFFLLSRLIVREKATRLSFDPILGLHVTFKYDCVLETEKSLFV